MRLRGGVDNINGYPGMRAAGMLHLSSQDGTGSSPQALELTVVIPSFNGIALLEQCLPTLHAALDRAQWSKQTEILVVDDHSTDGTEDWIKAHHPTVQVIHNTGCRGFAGVVNTGLRAARGSWIGLLNNDVLIDEQWLLAARPHFQNPSIASVATRMMMGGQAGTVEFAGGDYTPIGIPLRFGEGMGIDAAEIMQPRLCFWGCGAAVFYRRAALAQVGSELYAPLQAYLEDVELGFRLALAGWNCVYEPAAAVTHLGSVTYGKASFRKKFNSARNAEIVYFSCMPGPLLLRYLPAHCLVFLPQLAGHIIRGSGWGYACGKAAIFLAHLPATWHRRKVVQNLRKVTPATLSGKMRRRWLSAIMGTAFFAGKKSPAVDAKK